MSSNALALETARPSKALHVALWVFQALLAVVFLMAGGLKATAPIDQLAMQMPFVKDVPAGLVRFIGVAELAGAAGLILPSATRIRPVLTAWAGVGLATVMALAALFHLSRGEAIALPPNLLLGGLAATVAWGRFRKAKIAPRT